MKLTNQSPNLKDIDYGSLVLSEESKINIAPKFIRRTRPNLKFFIEKNSSSNPNMIPNNCNEEDSTALISSPDKLSASYKDNKYDSPDSNSTHPEEKKRYRLQRTLRIKKECLFDIKSGIFDEKKSKTIINVPKVEKISYPSEEYGNSKNYYQLLFQTFYRLEKFV